jgi:predicted Zn-dependent protease
MSKLRYDGHKMADFFEVLNKMNMSESQGGVPTFLSTHPDPGDRYNSVNKRASEWQDSLRLTSWKVNADDYLQLIDGIVYGEDPRQGYVEGNIFYHPELKFKFSYPSGWKLENAPTQVSIAPADGKALMIFTLSQQKSLQAAADSTLAAYGLKLVRSEKNTVNGMPAIVTLSQQVSENTSTGTKSINNVISNFIQYGSVIYVFHGVSAEADFGQFSPSMESSMKTFAQLTDASKINVKPQRILVKKVQRTGTLAEAFTSYGMKQDKFQELALLNNMELSDRVPAGTLIKITGE